MILSCLKRHSLAVTSGGQKSGPRAAFLCSAGMTTWANATPKYLVSETEHLITCISRLVHHLAIESEEHPLFTLPKYSAQHFVRDPPDIRSTGVAVIIVVQILT